MAAKTISIDDAKSANVAVVEEEGRGNQAVHDVVVAMRANRRSGTACTKTRGEVAESGKKPFRQKGTGRARQGGNANPLHRGGGVVFGPRPRDYSKKVTKGTRRLALAKVLSERIAAGDVLSVDSFAISDGKTRSFVSEVRSIAGEEAKRILIVGEEFDELTRRAGRNHQAALLVSPRDANVEQLLHYSKIVLVGNALEILAERTAR